MSNSKSIVAADKQLSAKQRSAILLIASGQSAEDVAGAVKVSKGTVHNWRSQNMEFRRELEAAQMAIYNDGIRQLQTLVANACTTLRSILVNPTARDHDRILAVKVVLQFAQSPRSPDAPNGANYPGADGFLNRMGLK